MLQLCEFRESNRHAILKLAEMYRHLLTPLKKMPKLSDAHASDGSNGCAPEPHVSALPDMLDANQEEKFLLRDLR
jgi:hypothetical protein